METRGKSAFFRPAFWGISSVFSLIYLVFFPKKYSTCDTCDSKKSTLLLEGARCAYTREGCAFSSLLAFHLHLGDSLMIVLFSGAFDRRE